MTHREATPAEAPLAIVQTGEAETAATRTNSTSATSLVAVISLLERDAPSSGPATPQHLFALSPPEDVAWSGLDWRPAFGTATSSTISQHPAEAAEMRKISLADGEKGSRPTGVIPVRISRCAIALRIQRAWLAIESQSRIHRKSEQKGFAL
jgi:hypothetical protein